jgi:hypothetical protein
MQRVNICRLIPRALFFATFATFATFAVECFD